MKVTLYLDRDWCGDNVNTLDREWYASLGEGASGITYSMLRKPPRTQYIVFDFTDYEPEGESIKVNAYVLPNTCERRWSRMEKEGYVCLCHDKLVDLYEYATRVRPTGLVNTERTFYISNVHHLDELPC